MKPSLFTSLGDHSTLEGDVAVCRSCCTIVEGLQFVVGLARQIHLGFAVARQVLAGDTHAPDDEVAPAVGLAVLPRVFPGADAPQLFACIAVVVAVVADAQVDVAVTVPVGEQERERAMARQGDARRVARIVGPPQGACIAVVGVGDEIVAERERRKNLVLLPRGRERGGPCGSGGEAE
jgi:hypothetical protein